MQGGVIFFSFVFKEFTVQRGRVWWSVGFIFWSQGGQRYVIFYSIYRRKFRGYVFGGCVNGQVKYSLLEEFLGVVGGIFYFVLLLVVVRRRQVLFVWVLVFRECSGGLRGLYVFIEGFYVYLRYRQIIWVEGIRVVVNIGFDFFTIY